MYKKMTKQEIKNRDKKILLKIMPNAVVKKKKLTLKQIFY